MNRDITIDDETATLLIPVLDEAVESAKALGNDLFADSRLRMAAENQFRAAAVLGLLRDKLDALFPVDDDDLLDEDFDEPA